MEEKIKLELEALDLSNIDNKLLVVRFDSSSLKQNELAELVTVFQSILKDMNKKLRIAFMPKGVHICLDCPKGIEIGKNAETELIKGKNERLKE